MTPQIEFDRNFLRNLTLTRLPSTFHFIHSIAISCNYVLYNNKKQLMMIVKQLNKFGHQIEQYLGMDES